MENVKLKEISVFELLNEVACVLDFVNLSLISILDDEKDTAAAYGISLVIKELVSKTNFVASAIPVNQKILMPDGVFTNQF